LAPRTLYDATLAPGPECTVTTCDPYAGWLSPSSVAVAPTGDVFLASFVDSCPYGDPQEEGIWRLDPSSNPSAKWHPVPLSDELDGRLHLLTQPLLVVAVHEGPNAGELLIVAASADSVEIHAVTADVDATSVEPILPSGLDLGATATVFPTTDGAFVCVDDEGVVTWWHHERVPLTLMTLMEEDLACATSDPEGNLWLAARSPRGSRLLCFDRGGTLAAVMTLHVRPVSIAARFKVPAGS
jgi:hypothetical protein